MIDRAAKFAEQAHKGTHRKGTRIPYIVHPLETALIASMLTNDEEILAAALLHDTIEDTGVTYEDLKQEFGTRVADLVAAESEDKSKTWIERKGHTLEHLKTASQAEKILTMADKRTRLSEEVESEVRSHFPEQTFETVIPRSVRISEAPSYGQTVITYDPRNVGAIAYRKAALELCQRLSAAG